MRTQRQALVAAVLLAVPALTAPAPARAQEATPPAPATESPSDATVASGSSEPPAARAFREAEARYQSGDTAGALTLMRKAYDLSARPELLFNLGQLHRELGDCHAALRDYEAYLADAKTGTRRAEAQRSVDDIQRDCPEQPPAPAAPPQPAGSLALTPTAPTPQTTSLPPSAPPPQPAPYWTPLRIAGWSSVGAGVVTGAIATYFAVHAANDASRLESHVRAAQSSPTSPGFSQSDKTLETDGEHSATLSRAFGISAAALAALGVSLVLVQGHAAGDAGSQVSLSAGPAGVSAGWQAGF